MLKAGVQFTNVKSAPLNLADPRLPHTGGEYALARAEVKRARMLIRVKLNHIVGFHP